MTPLESRDQDGDDVGAEVIPTTNDKQDEAKTPEPDGRGRTPGSLAALRRHEVKKGEIKNPKGNNGRQASSATASEFWTLTVP
jgi:hypothetical protein